MAIILRYQNFLDRKFPKILKYANFHTFFVFFEQNIKFGLFLEIHKYVKHFWERKSEKVPLKKPISCKLMHLLIFSISQLSTRWKLRNWRLFEILMKLYMPHSRVWILAYCHCVIFFYNFHTNASIFKIRVTFLWLLEHAVF